MDMTSTKFFDRFNGEINTGVNYSKGNRSTQYSISSDGQLPTRALGSRGRISARH